MDGAAELSKLIKSAFKLLLRFVSINGSDETRLPDQFSFVQTDRETDWLGTESTGACSRIMLPSGVVGADSSGKADSLGDSRLSIKPERMAIPIVPQPSTQRV